MYTIIKNVPMNMAVREFKDQIQPLLVGGFSAKHGEVKAVKLIQLIDKTNQTVECHAIVRVCSENMQKRLIQAINHSSFAKEFSLAYDLSIKISASPFIVRHWSNDRRFDASVGNSVSNSVGSRAAARKCSMNSLFLPMRSSANVERRASDRRRFLNVFPWAELS